MRRAKFQSPVYGGAVLYLELGSGANNAIFELVNALRLRTFRWSEADELPMHHGVKTRYRKNGLSGSSSRGQGHNAIAGLAAMAVQLATMRLIVERLSLVAEMTPVRLRARKASAVTPDAANRAACFGC
jgi:hypothetical protein